MNIKYRIRSLSDSPTEVELSLVSSFGDDGSVFLMAKEGSGEEYTILRLTKHGELVKYFLPKEHTSLSRAPNCTIKEKFV